MFHKKSFLERFLYIYLYIYSPKEILIEQHISENILKREKATYKQIFKNQSTIWPQTEILKTPLSTISYTETT